jgi:hypothetical protein
VSKFQVVDLRGAEVRAAVDVERATSPECAARHVPGIEVFRSGHRQDLMARVYWRQAGGTRFMLRLYRKQSGSGQELEVPWRDILNAAGRPPESIGPYLR